MDDDRRELSESLPTDSLAVTRSLASVLASCSTCPSWAEQDEGPYHRDAHPHATATGPRSASSSQPENGQMLDKAGLA